MSRFLDLCTARSALWSGALNMYVHTAIFSLYVYIRFCTQGMCSGSRKECFQLFVHMFNMLWMYLLKPNMLVHSLTFITGTSNSYGQFPRNAQGLLLWLHLTSYHKDIWKHMALVVTSQALSQKVAIWTLFLSNKC